MDEVAFPVGEWPELPPEMRFLTPEGFMNYRNPLHPQPVLTEEGIA